MNKISIRVKVRAIGRIGIEKRLMYSLTIPIPSDWDVSPKFLPKQRFIFEIVP